MSGARDIAICSSSQTWNFFFLMLTVQSVQFVQSDMAGPYKLYDDVLGVDMVEFDWQAWSNDIMKHGVFLVNGKVPRGPVKGCHVAPLYWFMSRYVKLLGSVGFDPRTSPSHKL
jgi:hypothetical protein